MKIYRDIYKDKSWLTVSNLLTFSRILIIPFIVIGIIYKNWNLVFILYLFAGISDLFDGYIARLLNQETFLGKALDPLADKLLIISSFASMAFIDSPSFFIPKWFVLIILIRELIIVFGSIFLLKSKIEFKINPTIWGKLTMLFQSIFIIWLFICYFFSWVPAKTYYILLILLAIFSVASFFQYLKIGLKYFLERN
ncbi:MAG: CDP-alcohol phosphatidyltransferase family protein [bacterium]